MNNFIAFSFYNLNNLFFATYDLFHGLHLLLSIKDFLAEFINLYLQILIVNFLAFDHDVNIS